MTGRDMRHLFSAAGDAALAEILRRRALLAFDFDGTLAPIVAHPDDARVSVAIASKLQRLCRSFPVAIITGRAVEDVRDRLGFVPHYIVGNHGAEDPETGTESDYDARLDGARACIVRHGEELTRLGVLVEDKQKSLALHFRLARDRRRAKDLIDCVLKDLPPTLRIFGGKFVVNVVTADAPDKGEAVTRLVGRTGSDALLFVGDDINDEPVFCRNHPAWLTVRVGRDYPESRAQFFLDSTAELGAMLQRMIALAPSTSKVLHDE